MRSYFKQVELPYSPQQVFDIVADIESYPQFLPHVASVRIRRRKGNNLWVDQQVRLRVLPLRFSTTAVLEPWSRIHVVCRDSPFGPFSVQWTFAAGSRAGTRNGRCPERDGQGVREQGDAALWPRSSNGVNATFPRSVLQWTLDQILRLSRYVAPAMCTKESATQGPSRLR